MSEINDTNEAGFDYKKPKEQINDFNFGWFLRFLVK